MWQQEKKLGGWNSGNAGSCWKEWFIDQRCYMGVRHGVWGKMKSMAILRRTERAMVSAMCGAKLIEKKRTEWRRWDWRKQWANGVRWYGNVLRRDDGHVLRKALEFEVKGKRKRGRPRKTWKTQVEKESKSVGLEKEDALNRARWKMGVGEIAVGLG